CRSVCENRVYDISTIDGWKLGSDLKALWYVRRIDDYPSVLIINYQSHVMVQLNWTSMMFEETHDCSNMTLLKLEEHPNLKGCFFLASRNRDNYFMLQKRGKLQIISQNQCNECRKTDKVDKVWSCVGKIDKMVL
uniref:Uncharacterized protein n=1 Tax=Romanomermis culicivorax TaxID=13658 RepID=A0A915I2Z2_ROMCU